jgi:peptide/nickel transport system substrate-binding protein
MLMAATAELSAPDDLSIVFRLRTPFPQLPEALGKATNNSAAIMPERLAMTDPFKQVTELVGSGPFRFKADERISGAKYVYEKFGGYKPREAGTPDWTAGPKVVNFDRVEWHVVADSSTAAAALRTGQFDWWELPPPDLVPLLRADKNIEVKQQDPAGYIGVFRMNHLNPPLRQSSHPPGLTGRHRPDRIHASHGRRRSQLLGRACRLFLPGHAHGEAGRRAVFTRFPAAAGFAPARDGRRAGLGAGRRRRTPR